MTAAINYLKTGAGEVLGTIRDTLRPENFKVTITASKIAKIVFTTLLINTIGSAPGADAGPIAAWISFVGCAAATIWVPWFMVECPEIALIVATLPTP
jgi:hypothetical protein